MLTHTWNAWEHDVHHMQLCTGEAVEIVDSSVVKHSISVWVMALNVMTDVQVSKQLLYLGTDKGQPTVSIHHEHMCTGENETQLQHSIAQLYVGSSMGIQLAAYHSPV